MKKHMLKKFFSHFLRERGEREDKNKKVFLKNTKNVYFMFNILFCIFSISNNNLFFYHHNNLNYLYV